MKTDKVLPAKVPAGDYCQLLIDDAQIVVAFINFQLKSLKSQVRSWANLILSERFQYSSHRGKQFGMGHRATQ
jgi:hypothetical protein